MIEVDRNILAGWAVSVEASAFVDEETSNVLRGVSLTFPAGTAETTKDNTSKKPTTHEIELQAGGASAILMDAGTDAGMGTWADNLQGNGEKVELHVPAGNYAGDYEAALTCTLTDAVN